LVEKKEDLIPYSQEGANPREQWRFGTEYEGLPAPIDRWRACPTPAPAASKFCLRKDYRQLRLRARGQQPYPSRSRATLRDHANRARRQSSFSDNATRPLRPTAHFKPTYNSLDRRNQHESAATVIGLGMQPLSRIESNRAAASPLPHHYPTWRQGQLSPAHDEATAACMEPRLSHEADAMAQVARSNGNRSAAYAICCQLAAERNGGLNGYHTFRGHILTDTTTNHGVQEFNFPRRCSFEELRRRSLRRDCRR